MLLYALISGILFGLFFSLMGLGLNLVFGVLRIVNLAHGDFLMLGAYGAYLAYTLAGVNFAVILVGELILLILIGIPLYYLLIPRLYRSRDPEMLSLILFFGFSQVIEAIAVIIFGNNPTSIAWNALGTASVMLFGQSYEISWIVTAGLGLLCIIALYFYLYRSHLGLATRAVMSNRDEARASGINVHQVSALAFGIGLALAAISGALSPFMIGSFQPTIGVGLTVTAFAIIVIGSLGNPLGTVVGGLVYGVSYMLMQTYLSSWTDLVPFLLLLVIVLIRPSGLLGRSMRSA